MKYTLLMIFWSVVGVIAWVMGSALIAGFMTQYYFDTEVTPEFLVCTAVVMSAIGIGVFIKEKLFPEVNVGSRIWKFMIGSKDYKNNQ